MSVMMIAACADAPADDPDQFSSVEQHDDNGEPSIVCLPTHIDGSYECSICSSDYPDTCIWVKCDSQGLCHRIPSPLALTVPTRAVVIVGANNVVSTWLDGAMSAMPLAGTDWDALPIGGARDFHGDGQRELYRTAKDGTVITGFDTYAAPSGATLARVADLDGDHRDDLVWRRSTGALVVTLEGGTRTSDVMPVLDSTWTLAGAGDFDGDGRAELVWKKGASLKIWTMDGAIRLGERTATLPDAATFGTVGDFDGDGKHDILFRDSSSTAKIWRSGLPSQATASFALPAAYTVEGARDGNGNGKDELVLRSSSRGDIHYQSLGITQVEGALVHDASLTARE